MYIFYVLRFTQNKACLRLAQIEPLKVKGYKDYLDRNKKSINPWILCCEFKTLFVALTWHCTFKRFSFLYAYFTGLRPQNKLYLTHIIIISSIYSNSRLWPCIDNVVDYLFSTNIHMHANKEKNGWKTENLKTLLSKTLSRQYNTTYTKGKKEDLGKSVKLLKKFTQVLSYWFFFIRPSFKIQFFLYSLKLKIKHDINTEL